MTRSLVRVLVSRHSAFYSPVVSTVAAGFLAAEGLEATYAVLPGGRSAREMIRSGEVDVVQAAVSSNWRPMAAGETDLPVHFAQINQRDGFVLVGRLPESGFELGRLHGRTLLADHGWQPLAMLRCALRRAGVDPAQVHTVDRGSAAEIEAAFRAGLGDYAHLQGPAAQELEVDGIGHVVASIGDALPPVAFSSLMAAPDFLETPTARAFVRAYAAARAWVRQAAAAEVAERQAGFFPGVVPEALSRSVARYQALGCWEGDVAITRALYDQVVAVFLETGTVKECPPFERVVVPPPLG